MEGNKYINALWYTIIYHCKIVDSSYHHHNKIAIIIYMFLIEYIYTIIYNTINTIKNIDIIIVILLWWW